MTERSTSEQAEQWLSEQVDLMKELRNATTRDAGFREWRQNTLTVLQRLWPGKPTRAQRFRRVAFAPPTGVNDEALVRESFEKGFAEARRLLQFWLAEIKLNGLTDHGGSIEPDGEDAFTMPKTEDAAASVVPAPSDLGIEKAEFPVEPSMGENAGLAASREETKVAGAGAEISAPLLVTSMPTRIEAPRAETPSVPTTPTRIEAPRAETPSVPTTPTRIEAPRAESPSVPTTPTRVDAPATPGPGAKPKREASAKRMGEIVKFPSPPPHAPEFRGSESKTPGQPSPTPAKTQERPAKGARPRNPRLKDMLGLGDDSGAEAALPTVTSLPPGPKSEPNAAAKAMPAGPKTESVPAAKSERVPSKPSAATRSGSGAKSAGSGAKSGGRSPSPGTTWSTPIPAVPPAAASPRAQAPTSSPSAPAAPQAQASPPQVSPTPAESSETRPTAERPGELVSAHESLIEAMTGVFVTKPDLGAPAEPPVRPEGTPASQPKLAAGSSPAPGETVIAFPQERPFAPASTRNTPGVPEIVALAGELERLGVPAAEMGRVRDALLNLALRLGTGKADWPLLQVGVSLVMRFPRLAARALPLLLPYFERAA